MARAAPGSMFARARSPKSPLRPWAQSPPICVAETIIQPKRIIGGKTLKRKSPKSACVEAHFSNRRGKSARINSFIDGAPRPWRTRVQARLATAITKALASETAENTDPQPKRTSARWPIKKRPALPKIVSKEVRLQRKSAFNLHIYRLGVTSPLTPGANRRRLAGEDVEACRIQGTGLADRSPSAAGRPAQLAKQLVGVKEPVSIGPPAIDQDLDRCAVGTLIGRVRLEKSQSCKRPKSVRFKTGARSDARE